MSEFYCKRCDDYRPCKCDQAEDYAKLENKVEELENAVASQKENAFEAWRLADYWRGAHEIARQKLKDIYNGTDLVDEMSVVVKKQAKSGGDEVMEIIAAALSGDCQKYLHHDADGRRYCKWAIVEKDIRAVLETSTDNNKCVWTQESDPEVFPDLWRTNCGNSFYLDAEKPSDNHMKYCCYCGKPIIETDNNKLAEGGD